MAKIWDRTLSIFALIMAICSVGISSYNAFFDRMDLDVYLSSSVENHDSADVSLVFTNPGKGSVEIGKVRLIHVLSLYQGNLSKESCDANVILNQTDGQKIEAKTISRMDVLPGIVAKISEPSTVIIDGITANSSFATIKSSEIRLIQLHFQNVSLAEDIEAEEINCLRIEFFDEHGIRHAKNVIGWFNSIDPQSLGQTLNVPNGVYTRLLP